MVDTRSGQATRAAMSPDRAGTRSYVALFGRPGMTDTRLGSCCRENTLSLSGSNVCQLSGGQALSQARASTRGFDSSLGTPFPTAPGCPHLARLTGAAPSKDGREGNESQFHGGQSYGFQIIGEPI